MAGGPLGTSRRFCAGLAYFAHPLGAAPPPFPAVRGSACGREAGGRPPGQSAFSAFQGPFFQCAIHSTTATISKILLKNRLHGREAKMNIQLFVLAEFHTFNQAYQQFAVLIG